MKSPVASAGILLFRRTGEELEVFLVHPGGPFFTRKDDGAWSMPKGLFEAGESPLDAARREFQEETGVDLETCAPGAIAIPLGTVRQRGGKTVHGFAFEGDWPPGRVLASNTFEVEWPSRSGKVREFPEVDRAEFFPAGLARKKMNPAQAELVDRLIDRLASSTG